MTDVDGNRVPVQGLWHIVKVEALIPSRCSVENSAGQSTSACSPGQIPNNRDEFIPTIETHVDAGVSKCYELVSYSGVVKIRVTRYDQARGTIFFPNGQPIWRFGYNRPGAATGSLEGHLSQLGTDCPSLPAPANLPQAFNNPYAGAFLLNSAEDSPQCWQRVHDLLRAGISSETCAQYYWHEGTDDDDPHRGMAFQFVPCENFPESF